MGVAEHYTRVNFSFNLPTDADAEAAVDLFTGTERLFEEGEDRWPDDIAHLVGFQERGVEVSSKGNRLNIRDDGGDPNLNFVAEFVREVLKRFMPCGSVAIEWANTCTMSRPDAFGGGVVFVTANAIATVTTLEIAEQLQTAFEEGRDVTTQARLVSFG